MEATTLAQPTTTLSAALHVGISFSMKTMPKKMTTTTQRRSQAPQHLTARMRGMRMGPNVEVTGNDRREQS